ncbi:MAG: hypothetical protein LIP28_02815 [Deltaproteobacteria bacterium]|nr:hypothetical protein [Deltaproteobacteria bacterium]
MKHLEPVVKKSASYSILFLRDDSKVVSFRLKPFWIKFLAVIFVVFSGASGAAGYAAHYYWIKYQTLQHERAELAEKLGENRRQLGRFAGVERIKESTLPRSSMVGVPSIASGVEGTNGKPNAVTENGPSTPPGSDDAQAPAEGGEARPDTADPPSGAGEPVVPETPPAGTLPSDNPPPRAVEPAPSANGADPPPASTGAAGSGKEIGEHPALISEVQIRPAGVKTFRLGFDLSNRDQQLTLNGRVHVAIGTKSGERVDITQISRDSLRFIINRYKRVNTEFVLPGDIRAEDVTSLYLTVTAEDQSNVTYTFPVPTAP